MNRVVQKFGGTSVATPEAREKVIEKIIQALQNHEMPIVVVSAIGRMGSPYATDTLIQFITQGAGELQDREYDFLLSCGEMISAVMMATMLCNKGYPAKALTGGQAGIITNGEHKNADLMYTRPQAIEACIEKGIIPVVAGFQGMTEEGELTTLGRGGSDTSAAILGAALNASRIDIYTDVDGIMTADPRVCQKANIISELSYNEVFQMADSGAKVIHPRAVEYAMYGNIPMVIKNTFSNASGTVIKQAVKENKIKLSEHLITSIAHLYDRVQFTIQDDIESDRDLLNEIAKRAISIDLINIFPTYKVFTINKSYQEPLETLLKNCACGYTLIEACSKITVIGERMTGVPGIMAKIVQALSEEHIEILQTADSLTTISCLVHEKHAVKAINRLHEIFGL